MRKRNFRAMKDETNLFIACDFIHGLLECYQTPCPILQSSISNIVILRKYSFPSLNQSKTIRIF